MAMLMFPPLAVPASIHSLWVKRAYKQGKYVEALSAFKVVKALSAASSIPFAFFMLLSVGYSSYNFEQKTPVLRADEPIEVAKRLLERTK